jgi:CRP-like cAMP-binding protein
MTSVVNHLIESLPQKDRLHLMNVCQPVELKLAEVLYERSKPTSYVYFPTEGFVSLIAMVDGSPGVEVGMVGREGMLGAQLALGVLTTPLHAVVQGAGTALRLNARTFHGELQRSPALQRVLNRYLYVLMAQLAESAACLRFHQIRPRLARWLLMSQDRAQSETFHVTQEFLAYMLGVRTAAAGDLQRSGLIGYRRGELTVIDRTGLEAAACSCYKTDQKVYFEILG